MTHSTTIRLTAYDPSGETGPVEREWTVEGKLRLTEWVRHGRQVVLYEATGEKALALPLHVDERNGWEIRVEVEGEEIPAFTGRD